MLGIILTPYGKIPGAYPSEIAYSYGGDGTFLEPDDPQFNTRGEVGFYFDTPLGDARVSSIRNSQAAAAQVLKLLPRVNASNRGWFANRRARRALNGLGHSVPTDFELAQMGYGYLPQIDGWVTSKEGFQPGSWIPPNGYNPAGSYGSQFVPASYRDPSLGDAAAPVVTPEPTAHDIIMQLNEHNNKVFTLSLVSTIAIALSAVINTVRNAKLMRQETRLVKEQRQLLRDKAQG